ncbi:hypothetical protein, partial [Acetobacter oeni]
PRQKWKNHSQIFASATKQTHNVKTDRKLILLLPKHRTISLLNDFLHSHYAFENFPVITTFHRVQAVRIEKYRFESAP